MLELDVFTLFPHWFAWLSEERPGAERARPRAAAAASTATATTRPLKHRAVDDAPVRRRRRHGAARRRRRRRRSRARTARRSSEVRAARRIVALDPGGRPLDDAYARELAAATGVTLLCGRYEGFDARDPRARRHRVAVARPVRGLRRRAGRDGRLRRGLPRCCPGPLGDEQSSEEESFSPALEGALEYPHYTRPEEFRGWRVPEVLLSGTTAGSPSGGASRPRQRSG